MRPLIRSLLLSIAGPICGLLIVSGCFSSHLKVEHLTKNYAVLSYEQGAMIPQIDETMRVQQIREVCPSGNYEIVEEDRRTVGQYRFRTTILFRCDPDGK